MSTLKSSWLYRGYQVFNARRGSLLASGIAFTGLFSMFGALASGFTVFALVLGTEGRLYQDVLSAVDENLPGLLKTADNPNGAVDPATLVQSNLWSVGGAIAFATTLWAGLKWIDALREGVRAMMGQAPSQANVVVTKVWDVLNLAFIGLGILASALLGLVLTSAASTVLDALGLGSGALGQWVLRILTFVVVAAVDAMLMLVILRRMSRLDLPWHDVRRGVVVGALGLGLLKQFAGMLLSNVGGNPVLATGAVLVGLLFWLSLVSQVTLITAALVDVDVQDNIEQRRLAAGGGAAFSMEKSPPDTDTDAGESVTQRDDGMLSRWWGKLRGR